MSGYVNAKEVLPPELVREIQRYVQGRQLYIPRVERRAWGTMTGIREELDQRNTQIVECYRAGVDIPKLADIYGLSEERIRAVIYESETE